MSIEKHPQEVVLEQDLEQVVQPPPFYQVIMLNDDFTPMDFVVDVLMRFFDKTHEQAIAIMLAIHHDGRGICGEFVRDVAETKVSLVIETARKAGHPLKCLAEPI
jgi:ATP-dependent Clp protease adaptor protein ClpS